MFPSLLMEPEARFNSCQVYKDDTHKPEMAIAISDFEALCGFITAPELAEVLTHYPEIHPCIGASSIESAVSSSGREQQKAELKQVFTALMTCDTAKVQPCNASHLLPHSGAHTADGGRPN